MGLTDSDRRSASPSGDGARFLLFYGLTKSYPHVSLYLIMILGTDGRPNTVKREPSPLNLRYLRYTYLLHIGTQMAVTLKV